jgi:hypothetical protein
MRRFYAFTHGFWSAFDFDFTAPKRYFHHQTREKFDLRKERKRIGLSNLNCWESVGKSLRESMGDLQSEIDHVKTESTK